MTQRALAVWLLIEAAALAPHALAQNAPPSDASPSAGAPTAAPQTTGAAATQGAEPTTPANVPQPAASPSAAPASTPAPTGAAPAPAAQQPSAEALRLARERWQMEVMRARLRRRTPTTIFPEAEHEAPAARVHGDASAPFAIGLSLENAWYTDRSYDVFSSNDLAARGGVWLGYDVAALRRDTFVAVELGWMTEHASDSSLLGGTLGSELSTQNFYGGAQLRWVPLAFLQPHVRLAGGASWVKMALETTNHLTRYADAGVAPFGSLGLGFTLRTPTRMFEDQAGHFAALSVGLMIEGGYTLASPITFQSGAASNGRDIAILDPKLGKLDRSGPYLRASLVTRF